ncbi:unnamed protein product [Cladocopium goreaui]|uniref:Uncharacterized protein n=1 Tax=Cladocopium goreaui TaxID=2562237 RepID=A0A9P1BNF3_9DINO|nr:unnamed protein product [Cladocopium goreaui]
MQLPSIREAGDTGRQTPSESSGSHSSNWQNDKDGSSSNGESESGSEGRGHEEIQSDQSSDSSEYTSIVSSSLTSGQRSRNSGRTKLGGASFGGAVSGLVDVLQYSLHAVQPPGPRAALATNVTAPASPDKSDQEPELSRVPSLRTLLKFPEGDGHEAGEESVAKRTQRSNFKDSHGRAKLNSNIAGFETLALGLGRDKSKKESDLQKSWGEIAGKLAFVLTKVDQVVPMSKARLLNEALGGDEERRLSEESRHLLQMIMQSKKFLGSTFHSLLESDPVRVLKDSLEARLNSGPGGGLFAQQEELSAYEKEISVRENQMDNPEFVDMMLQRWFIQKGFCINNMAERRQLAEEFWKLQRANALKKTKRLQSMSTRKSVRSSMSLEAFQSVISMRSEQEQDLSSERGILLEIRRAMTKLKRKCRVLEGQWVEQPRMMLPRLEKQCRTLRTKVEDKFHETETTRQKLCEADARWQRSRDGYEPTLVDLELQAWDTRVELAKSVIRWVRRDRKEQQVEWNARMAKYHADKTRMRGNFDYTLRRWREDGCWTSPGFNPWKASLAFTPDSLHQADEDRTQAGKVQVDQGLTISGLTRAYLINQEKLLDNVKRPLGNRWELLRRQYANYCSILEGQIEHWLRGDFLGPVLRQVRDLTGHLNTFVQEVLEQLEDLREGAVTDLHMPSLQGEHSPDQEGGAARRSVKVRESNRADARMEDALTAVLVHAEKEHAFLNSLTAFNGELAALGRCQAELSQLAARRPFTFQDLCEGRTISKGTDVPPISFEQLEEGIESPAKVARQLTRLVQINWTTYLLKWEVLISKHKAARVAYVDYLDKVQESARHKLMRDLKEKPHLKQELLQKTRSKMKEVEENFYATHVQPEVLRWKSLSAEVADMTMKLQEMKSKTKQLEQDVSLNFVRSLELESHEDLLKRYQTEYEEERERTEQLDKQLDDAKERQRVAKENSKPSMSEILQVNHILRQLDEAKAQEQTRHMFFLDEVIQSDQIHPDEIKKALNERGLQATPTAKQLLRVLQSLSSTWTVEDKVEESERNDSKKNDVEKIERLKNPKKGEAMKAIQPGEVVQSDSTSKVQSQEERNKISEGPNTKEITRRLSWRLPSSSSLASLAVGDEDTIATACKENETARPSALVEVIRAPEVPSEEIVKKTEQVSGNATAIELGQQRLQDSPVEDKESLGAQNPDRVLNSEEQRVPITDAIVIPGPREVEDGGVPESVVIDLTEEAHTEPEDRPPPTVKSPTGRAGQTDFDLLQTVRRDASDVPESDRTRLEQDLEDGSETSLLTKPEARPSTPNSRPDEPAEWVPAEVLKERRVVFEDESLEEVLDAGTSPKSPQVEERRVVFDEGLEEVLEDAVTSPKPPQFEVPAEPREAIVPEMHVDVMYQSYHDEATVASRQPTKAKKPKKLKAQNSISSWMQEVSRALLAHSEVSSEPSEELEKQLTARASLQFLLNRRKRRRGLPTSLWPELSVGNSPSARKDFSASQPLRTKTGRLPRSDTPEMQPSIHAILESASPASAVRSGRSPTGRLRKRSLKANFAGTPLALDVGQGKAPKLTSSPRLSQGKLCRGAMSHFRDQLPTRSFHGSGNGLKLAVAPGLEAFLWGHTRPRGEWRGLLQTKSKETPAFNGVEELVVKHVTKEKPTKLLQRRHLMQLYQAVEAKAANKKLAAANRFESDFTLLPARSSESRQTAFRESVLETARNAT